MGQAKKILKALGGADNVADCEPCITRLRIEVRDASAVVEAGLTAAGVQGVLRAGAVIQLIVGPAADQLANEIKRAMDRRT